VLAFLVMQEIMAVVVVVVAFIRNGGTGTTNQGFAGGNLI
jgi:hypothetical protein